MLNYFNGICQDLKTDGNGLIIFLLLDIYPADGLSCHWRRVNIPPLD
jgi:hypothetical protein